MALITIKDLNLSVFIGTEESEKTTRQDILVTASFSYDSRNASASDNLKYAVDYKALQEKIKKYAESGHFYLIETLADGILNTALEDPLIEEAAVTVKKATALSSADYVSVEVSKKKGE